MRKILLAVCPLLFFAPLASMAQDESHDADREALIVILGGIEAALNAQDLSQALKYLDEDVIITYQDSTVTQGHSGATEYYNRMMEGAGAIVSDFSTKAAVGAPAVFHGDTAVAYGTNVDHYVLTAGLEMDLNANWSMAARKVDGEWKVIAMHFSSDLFDNPLLNNSRRLTRIVGVVGLLAGMFLMWLIGRMRRKRAA
jgi:ketosteroid isomerase-like protein